MTDLIRRTSAADLEIRGDGRTVVGLAVPFDEPTDIGPYVEVFRRGAFTRTLAERTGKVKFLANHDYEALPVGRATLLREDAAGLYSEFKVSKTVAGDEALELIRDGALDALSVGFRPVRQRTLNDGQVERLEVALYEVSAVAFPAYEGALIAAVRSEQIEPEQIEPDPLDEYRQQLAALTGPTTTMTTMEARRRLLKELF